MQLMLIQATIFTIQTVILSILILSRQGVKFIVVDTEIITDISYLKNFDTQHFLS